MNKYYSVIATVGAVVLLLGAALQITKLVWAPYFYLIGAIMFAYVQVMSGYEGKISLSVAYVASKLSEPSCWW